MLVRSDVILVIPKHGIVEHFTGTSEGYITEVDQRLETNPVYPWLDNNTFNKWFVPKGCDKPISSLSVKKSLKYDFRAKAFGKLFSYLESQSYITKNLPVKDEKKHTQLKLLKQPTYLICGPTCAGKTVLAKHINHKLSYYHIEASDFMYLSFHKLHGTSSSVEIHSFAKAILKENPKIVAERIIPFVHGIKDLPVVITGFRDPKEVSYFLSHYEEDSPVKLVYIDCEQEIRYQRNIKRARYDKADSLDKFKQRDETQFSMGLTDIKNLDYCYNIINESSIRDFYNKFDSDLTTSNIHKFYLYKRHYKELITTVPRLERLILLTLFENYSDKHYTTTQIAHLVNENFKSVFIGKREPLSPSNVGRYFNSKFHPYYEVTLTERNRNSYRLSQTGISEAKLQLHILLHKNV